MTSPAGTTIGSIRIEQSLKSGGSDGLLLGRQPALERLVALRKLPGELLEEASLIDRFRREARLGARIHHPNVVGVLDCFAYRGDHYLVMEYVDGPNLRKVIGSAGPAPEAVALSIGVELLRGLAELHARGIVHAHIAPEEILISRWGEPKLTGLDRAQETNEDSPPPVEEGPYTAPELIAGEPGTGRADLYSVGGLLAELLTGTPPELQEGPLRGTKRSAWRLISKCLEPDPARRPASANELRNALESLLDRPDPQHCRSLILEWLYGAGVLRPAQAAQLDLAELGTAQAPGAPRARLAALAWGLSGAAVAGLAFVALFRMFSVYDRAPSPTGAVPAVPAVSAGAPTGEALARVRFVVHPWAQVEVDGRPPFLTPRAEALEIEPGEHTVVLRHPLLGSRKLQFRVEAGEERTIREVLSDDRSS
ncbi:MAG: serine/threonine-protein kinase [Myxococcota bacterium]